MIRALKTKNVGPINELDINFGSRLNIITGDNGLGKSFILDLIWWSLTRTWVQKINTKLTHGYMARPCKKKHGEISFTITGNKENISSIANNLNSFNFTEIKGKSIFDYESQSWQDKQDKQGEQTNSIGSGLVIYAMPDGSFALWDSARNYIDKKKPETLLRQPAYIFSLEELWNGLETKEGTVLCNGIIRDWALWQKENGLTFERLSKTLECLSVENEGLKIGKLTRVDINDARDMPTIIMPYGDETPIIHASSAIKRIIAFAYILVWAMSEHGKASELLNKEPAGNITFLIDELDAHLHPRWQRTILPTLLEAVRLNPAEASEIALEPYAQLIAITHSPFTLLSVEGDFDEDEFSDKDVWLDIDLNQDTNVVTAKQRRFLRKGDVANWLTSEAFDLKTDFSFEKERVFLELQKFLAIENPSETQAKKIATKLDNLISELDPLWLDFLDLCKSKGWSV